MSFGKIKLKLYNFTAYSYKDLEIYLMEMALKGWKLEKIIGMFLKFKAIEPKVIRYTVNITDEIYSLDGKKGEDSLKYSEGYKYNGWTFLCQRQKLQVYCSEDCEIQDVEDIDERKKFERISKISFREILNFLFSALVIIGIQFNNFFSYNNASFLANIGILLISFIFIIHIINVSIGSLNYFNWKKKSKRALYNGEKISYSNPRMSRLRMIFAVIELLLLIIAFLFMFFDGKDIFIFSFLTVILMVVTINFIVKKIRGSTFNKLKKMILISCSFLVMIFVISFGSIFITTIFDTGDISIINKFDKSVYPLIIGDFNIQVDNNDKYIRKNKSLIASYLTYSEWGENINLDYRLFESKYNWAINYDLYKIFKSNKKFYKGINFGEIYKLKERKTTLPEDIKVYSNSINLNYIIVSKNKVLEISSLEDGERIMNENEFLNLVYNNVFK